MSGHTPGPWRVQRIVGRSGESLHIINDHAAAMGKANQVFQVADMAILSDGSHDANAARIVACVNACEGMDDPAQGLAALRKAHGVMLDQGQELAALRQHLAESREDAATLDLQRVKAINERDKLAAALRNAMEAFDRIKAARDYCARRGDYPRNLLSIDQCFDDWAADIAETVNASSRAALAKIEGGR